MTAAFHSKSNNNFTIINTVQIGDIALVALMVFSLFSYGTVWNGFSAGQITLFRLAGSFFAVLILLCKSSRFRERQFDAFGLLATIYALYVSIQGLFAPAGQAGAVVQGLLIFLVCNVPAYFATKYGFQTLNNILFYLFFMVVCIMDLFAFATNGRGFPVIESAYLISSNFIFGNKFLLAYANMLTFGLGGTKLKSRISLFVMGLGSLASCAASECSTGVIGMLAMLVVTFWPLENMHAGRFKHGWIIVVLIVGMAVVAIAGTWIMTLPVVQSFTVGVLGETADFSGRLPIYEQLIGWFLEKPIFGYGSSLAANAVVVLNNGAADCQEGLFQIILTNGLLGAGLFIALCYVALKNADGAPKTARGLYSYLIAMAFASLVEINLGPFFLLGLSLMRGASEIQARIADNNIDVSTETSYWSGVKLGQS